MGPLTRLCVAEPCSVYHKAKLHCQPSWETRPNAQPYGAFFKSLRAYDVLLTQQGDDTQRRV